MADFNLTQRQIFRALRALGGRSDAQTIREWIADEEGREVSSSNLGRQAKADTMEGLVEVVGERDVGAPLSANVYALTETGEKRAEETFDESLVGGGNVDDEVLRSVQRDIADLKTAMEQTQQDIESAADAEDLAEIRSSHADLRSRVSDLEGTVEYHGEVLDRVDERLQELGERISK